MQWNCYKYALYNFTLHPVWFFVLFRNQWGHCSGKIWQIPPFLVWKCWFFFHMVNQRKCFDFINKTKQNRTEAHQKNRMWWPLLFHLQWGILQSHNVLVRNEHLEAFTALHSFTFCYLTALFQNVILNFTQYPIMTPKKKVFKMFANLFKHDKITCK